MKLTLAAGDLSEPLLPVEEGRAGAGTRPAAVAPRVTPLSAEQIGTESRAAGGSSADGVGSRSLEGAPTPVEWTSQRVVPISKDTRLSRAAIKTFVGEQVARPVAN